MDSASTPLVQVELIDAHTLYNIVNREVPTQQKNQFLLYDIEGNFDRWPRAILMNEAINVIQQSKQSKLNSRDVSQCISPNKRELFTKFRLNFNIIMPFSKTSPMQTFLLNEYLVKHQYAKNFIEMAKQMEEIFELNPAFKEDVNY